MHGLLYASAATCIDDAAFPVVPELVVGLSWLVDEVMLESLLVDVMFLSDKPPLARGFCHL